MASVETEVSDDIFTKLKRADPKEIERRQEAINQRLTAAFQKNQQSLAELIDRNSTLPTTVSEVTILGAKTTREGFLRRVVDPLLSANRDRPYTQAELLRESAAVAEKLRAFGTDSCSSGAVCSR
jgi:outer membrane protein insertion porin family